MSRLFALLFIAIVAFPSCKDDPKKAIGVSYNVVKDASGNSVINANIQNTGGVALTNVGIDFITPDHIVIPYIYTGIVCEGQNVDVVVVPDSQVEFIEKAEVTTSEVTACDL